MGNESGQYFYSCYHQGSIWRRNPIYWTTVDLRHRLLPWRGIVPSWFLFSVINRLLSLRLVDVSKPPICYAEKQDIPTRLTCFFPNSNRITHWTIAQILSTFFCWETTWFWAWKQYLYNLLKQQLLVRIWFLWKPTYDAGPKTPSEILTKKLGEIV